MNENMQRALDNVAAAKEALARTEQEARDLAMAQLKAAQEACEAAGVKVATEKRGTYKRSPEARQKMREASQRRWASKTPEERAAWAAKIAAGQRGNKNAAVN